MIYVDPAVHNLGRMKMCHMVADSVGELHHFAGRLGLKLKWFQNKRIPHYDICQHKRRRAIELGAKEVTSRDIVAMFRTRGD